MWKIYQLGKVSIIITILSGCGGGGSSSTNTPTAPAPKPVPIEITIGSVNQTITINEGETAQVNIPVSYSGSKTLSYTADSASSVISATMNESQLVVSSVDIDTYNDATDITVSVTDGALTNSITISATVKNTSLEALYNGIERAIPVTTSTISRSSLTNVANRYNEQAYMLGIISSSEFSKMKDDIASDTHRLHSSIEVSMLDLPLSMSDVVSEKTFSDVVENYIGRIDDYHQYALSIINEISAYGDIMLPSLSNTGMIRNNALTPFYGNVSYGDYVNGTFTYSQNYALLAVLDPSDGQACSTSNNLY